MGRPYNHPRSLFARLTGFHRSRSITPRAVVLALLIIIVYLTLDGRGFSSLRSPSPPGANGIGRDPVAEYNQLHAPEVVDFWKKLVGALVAAKPAVDEIKPERAASREDERVDPKAAKSHQRLDLIDLTDDDLRAMKRSHARFAAVAKALAPSLPYKRKSRGVVMTAGGAYFGMAITSVRMLRRTGSALPVEVFLDSWKDYDITTCEVILPELGARCLVLADIWQTTPQLGALLKYQFKVFALLFSSFQDILFLDADAFPAHKPDALLDVEPYKSTGLVTWPDFWVSTTSHYLYDIAGVAEPSLDARRASESGIMVYSKRLHAPGLLLAVYYNYYGPKHYYPLFSQGAQGEGDKETFLHAAMALDEPFYDVRTSVTVMGSMINGTWWSAGMKQGDPVEDYALRQAAAAKKPESSSPPSSATMDHAAETSGDSSSSPPAEEEQSARALFIHNNIVKLDVHHLFDWPERWRNETGARVRLWGPADDVVHTFGYDAEVALWRELLIAACAIDQHLCFKARAHVGEVFPGQLDVDMELAGRED
jgi:alpha 1,2-mannosyltransferase